MEAIVRPLDIRLSRQSWLSKFFSVCWVVGILGMAFWAYERSHNEARAMFSYLFSFMTVLSLALGCLIFVLIHHATRAGWSVVIRRVPETVIALLPLFALLFIPIWYSTDILYSWTHAAPHDEILKAKAPYLNTAFFTVRSVLYFVVWSTLGILYYRWSVAQDGKKNQQLTRKMWRLSPIGIIIFGLSASFAAFDWLMSLQPHWFSTIFGVYFFAGCILSGIAFITLMCVALQSCGVLNRSMTSEHYHDLGKLLFGYTVFWAYIGFSQFMLIWYANLPEETEFYLHRLHHGWEYISWALPLTNFFLPFFILMSRHIKKKKAVMIFMCLWILTTHFMDIYWLVLPGFVDDHGFSHLDIQLVDIACLFGMMALFLGCFGFLFKRNDAMPTGDSRLPESLSFENF